MRRRILAALAVTLGTVALSARADTSDLPDLPALAHLPHPVALVPLVSLDADPEPAPAPEHAPTPTLAHEPARSLAPTLTRTQVSVPAVTDAVLGQTDEYRRAIAAYTIDVDPVRVSEFDRCVQAGSCTTPSCSSASTEARATCVDASQAAAYCAYAGGRLPTEDEWEHAARDAKDLGLQSMPELAEWTASPYCFFCDRDDRVVRGGPARDASLRGWRPPATSDASIGFRCAR